MKIVYFESPVSPERLVYTITEKPIKSLVEDGILKPRQKYVVKEYESAEKMDPEDYFRMLSVNCMKFDNKAKPKDIVIDSDLAILEHMEILKGRRNELLVALDNLQMRYLVQGKQNIVDEIEKDKQVLRDMPADLKLGRVDSMARLQSMIPTCLMLDYEDKYKDM